MPNSISLKGLTHKYDPRKTDGINGLNASIPLAKVSTIIGPSGSGKSTTLKCIAGLIDNYQGEISFPEKMSVSYLDQSSSLTTRDETVFEFLDQHLKKSVEQATQRENQIRTVLLDLELTNEIDSKLNGLSGGQQQRVYLAKALITNPTLLLLDEPFANLDPILRDQFLKDLFGFLDEKEITIVLVTHSIQEALAYSDHIILLNYGELQQQGSPRELYFAPKSIFTAQFISKANIFTVKYQQESNIIKINLLNNDFEMQSQTVLKPEGSLFLGILPEDISISDSSTKYQAIIEEIEFQGPSQLLTIRLQNTYLEVRTSSRENFNIKSKIFLNLKHENFIIIGQA